MGCWVVSNHSPTVIPNWNLVTISNSEQSIFLVLAIINKKNQLNKYLIKRTKKYNEYFEIYKQYNNEFVLLTDEIIEKDEI